MRNWIDQVLNDGITRYLDIFNRERLVVTNPKVLAEMLVHKSYEVIKPPTLFLVSDESWVLASCWPKEKSIRYVIRAVRSSHSLLSVLCDSTDATETPQSSIHAPADTRPLPTLLDEIKGSDRCPDREQLARSGQA